MPVFISEVVRIGCIFHDLHAYVRKSCTNFSCIWTRLHASYTHIHMCIYLYIYNHTHIYIYICHINHIHQLPLLIVPQPRAARFLHDVERNFPMISRRRRKQNSGASQRAKCESEKPGEADVDSYKVVPP